MNRIQKLLLSEYCDFEDIVLLESPFAETTREGKGIRQIQLGLTPTKMIIAEDYLSSEYKVGDPEERKKFYLSSFQVSPELDPDTETLELVSVIPVECINLSVFHRRKKHTLKARFCNGQVLYFELGGFRNRKMLWNLWREKVKFLSPEEDGSSVSETSAASSSTCSTLFLVKTRSGVTSSGVHQIWNLYSKESEALTRKKPRFVNQECCIFKTSRSRWTNRNLFPTEIDDDYDNLIRRKTLFQEYGSRDLMEGIIEEEQESCEASSFCSYPQWSLHSEVEMNPISMEERREDPIEEKPLRTVSKGIKLSNVASMVNRFGLGVQENCGIGLYLYPLKNSKWDPRGSELYINEIESSPSMEEFIKIMDAGVEIWEQDIRKDYGKTKPRYFRRYGLMPCPQFNHGFGPFWEYFSKGDKHSVQSRQVASSTELDKVTSPDVELQCPRNHLTATISYEALILNEEISGAIKNYEKQMNKYPSAPLPSVPIFFWTTDLSFWPQPARDMYMKQQCILKRVQQHISSFHNDSMSFKFNVHKEDSLGAKEKMNSTLYGSFTDEMEQNTGKRKRIHSKSKKLKLQKENGIELVDCADTIGRSALKKTRKLLRLHIRLTAWDFNSATLAHQLTMIDRDLFLQIPVTELVVLVQTRSHIIEKCFLYPMTSWQRGAPCFGAFAAFSHRVACLVSSEVIKGETVKVRARLIARFINAAHKCYQLQNFQSCQSILSGLQSPAIYRLHKTWSYLRLQHANKYEVFELLSKFYRDPRLLGHHHTFSKDLQKVPFIPSIQFLVYYLLGIIPLGAGSTLSPFEINSFKKSEDKLSSTEKNHRKCGSFKCEASKYESKSMKGGILSKGGSQVVRRLVSSLKIWPFSNQRKNKSIGGYDVQCRRKPTISANELNVNALMDDKPKINWNCWLNENAPELSGYFEKIPSNEEDEQTNYLINIENCCDNPIACSSCSYEFDEYRMEKISKSAELLLASQYAASHYALFQSDLAREYLLKARYKEHRDNYIVSFQVESM